MEGAASVAAYGIMEINQGKRGMKFEWDETKRSSNLSKHGLDFADAPAMFDLAMFVVLDEREDYGEPRYQGIGLLNGNFAAVVFTEPDEDTIRLISLRRATPQERRIYERAI